MAEPKWEKMAKSRGNVVLPEEVVYGVCNLERGYEFRDILGQIVDWQKIGIWRDKGKLGDFFTATKFGRQPVFLCQQSNPAPCVLLIDGAERVQHPDLPEKFYVVFERIPDEIV